MDHPPDRLYGWGYAGHSVDDLVAFAQTRGVHAARLREGDEVVDGVARIPPAVQPVRGVVHAPILSQKAPGLAPLLAGRVHTLMLDRVRSRALRSGSQLPASCRLKNRDLGRTPTTATDD